ncbi:MAG: extracellular solute-binding protein [Desulfobacterales bacterium]|nr:extracellular solute-binding protein [Desulfobacterales bacterium]
MRNKQRSTLWLMLLLSGLILWADTLLAGPLDEIVAASKKEGEVSLMLRTGFTPRSIERLGKEIKDLFGVDLKIKFTPVGGMPKSLAEAIMEHKAGAPPSYDLMTFSAHVVPGMKAGIFERVDWKSIVTKDTHPDVIPENKDIFGAMIYYTGILGLMYNPGKIPADQVPRTLKDLSNPKWKNKVGLSNFTNSWARWAKVLGKDRVLSDLRDIMKNGAIQGRYVDVYNRYLLGEVDFAFVSSAYLKQAMDQGQPAAWQSLDFADIREYSLVIRKGAKHPNAAKLVGVFLGSPQGAKFTLEESKSGNLYYPGNYEHDLSVQNKKQGVREITPDRIPELVAFSVSKEAKEWEKEIKLIFQTGGTQKAKKKK